MNNYKYNWKSDKFDKWQYQNEETENAYREFIKQQEEKDADLAKDIEDHKKELIDVGRDDLIKMEEAVRKDRTQDPWNFSMVID